MKWSSGHSRAKYLFEFQAGIFREKGAVDPFIGDVQITAPSAINSCDFDWIKVYHINAIKYGNY